ncbi:TPA_asm: hypothetical protein GYZ54_14285 [Listeria monocytogenes]|nr:hypothetical protein [Listeria monocytogenes]
MEIGSLAEWFSAVGTIGAVIISLYLANKKPKRNLLISHKLENTAKSFAGTEGVIPTVVVTVTNLEIYPERIERIDFKFDHVRFSLSPGSTIGITIGKKLPYIIKPNSKTKFYFKIEEINNELNEKNVNVDSSGEVVVLDSMGNKHKDKTKLVLKNNYK